MSDQVFDTFLRTYPADDAWAERAAVWRVEDAGALLGSEVRSFSRFLSEYAAPSHGSGVVKFMSRVSRPTILEWNSDTGWWRDWTQCRGRVVAFGYDWLGCLLGLDKARIREGEPLVSILETGTGKLLQTPHTFTEFLHHAATDHAEAALSVSFYSRWLGAGGGVPPVGMCAGYKIPLFLNGKDTVENLSLQDLRVYISLSGQLYTDSRKYPPGTRYGGVTIS